MHTPPIPVHGYMCLAQLFCGWYVHVAERSTSRHEGAILFLEYPNPVLPLSSTACMMEDLVGFWPVEVRREMMCHAVTEESLGEDLDRMIGGGLSC